MEFWLYNPNVLFQNDIFPNNNMSYVEKLNAIARFSLIFLILLYLFNGDMKWMALSVTFLILTILFNKNMEKLSEISCHPKTVNNPFGNFTLSDYMLNPNRPASCDISDIKKSVELVDKSVPLIADHYNKDIALRNFYTQPITTLVNNQTEFANFLLGKSGDCKINGNNCLEHQDTRYHRGRFFNSN